MITAPPIANNQNYSIFSYSNINYAALCIFKSHLFSDVRNMLLLKFNILVLKFQHLLARSFFLIVKKKERKKERKESQVDVETNVLSIKKNAQKIWA